MTVDAAPIRLAVLGPPDLLVTALIAALGTNGVVAERLPLHEALSQDASFPHGGPGVLIVDIDGTNPGIAVREATRAGLTVLAIGSEPNRERAVAAMAAGAVSWVRKTSSLQSLAETVRAAADGRMQMSDQKRAGWVAEHRDTNDSVRAEVERLERLSPREREVLRHLADGRRAAEISSLLFLSITTVRSHIQAILVKLGLNTQQHAAEVYRETSRHLGRIRGTEPGR